MTIWDIDLPLLDGSKQTFPPLKGKALLVVNVVSKCGYLPQCSTFWSFARTVRQFRHLQNLQEEFGSRGFSVVGVPCNQFGKMEPSENEEINQFIKTNYPFVSFPITQKIEVNGKNRHDLYSFLLGDAVRTKSDSPADLSENAIEGWNREGGSFSRIPHSWEKFVISRNGTVVTRFNWQAMPLDSVPLTTGESWTIRECLDEILG